MKLRNLPLSALRAFTVTAETGSVGRAAEELAVTPGAVSRQLTNLEEWVGQPLFIREGRRLRLTAVGQRLASQAGTSLNNIISVCTDLRGIPKRRQISIVSPATFTMNWLMPRIAGYELVEKDVDIWLKTRMSDEKVDFSSTDLVVTRGQDIERKPTTFKSAVILEEMLTVLAAPDFISARGIGEPRDVLNHPRIASLTRPADWASWLELAYLADEPASLRHRFDHQFVAMHATRAGIGSIVAPANLFTSDANLTVPFPDKVLRGSQYVLHHRPSGPAYVRRFVSWLLEHAA